MSASNPQAYAHTVHQIGNLCYNIQSRARREILPIQDLHKHLNVRSEDRAEVTLVQAQGARAVPLYHSSATLSISV